MGIYTVPCPLCKELHLWFSGNVDQRCLKCVDKPKKHTLAEREQQIQTLYDKIKHGDEAHQQWLLNTIEEHFKIKLGGVKP